MQNLRIEKFVESRHRAVIEELTALLHSAYAALAKQGMRYWASYQSPAETLERLSDGDSYLAFYGERLAGTINLAPPDPENKVSWYRREDVCSFHQFAVAPDLQGKGIGEALLAQAEARAKELSYAEIALDTSERAERLIATYSKRGYRHVEYVNWDSTNYRSVVLSRGLR